MIGYHTNEEISMKIFPTQTIARINRQTNEVTVPFGTLHGIERWANMLQEDYIAAKFFPKCAH